MRGASVKLRSLLFTAIGAKVADARARFPGGLNQSDLAGRVGVTRAAVSALETGMQGVSVTTLCKMAAALEVAPGSLLPDKDELDTYIRATEEKALDPSPAEIVDEFLQEVSHGSSKGKKRGKAPS